MAERIDKRLRRYSRKKGLRKGTKSYNRYVYGTVSRRMAAKARRKGRRS
jgi:hypothetical protein